VLPPEVRSVLVQLEEATHTRGCLFLVREAADPHPVYWASGSTALLSADDEALADRPTSWWEAVEPEDRDALREALDRDGSGRVLEYRVRGVAPRWLRESMRRVDVADGSAFLVSVVRDVSVERGMPRDSGERPGRADHQPSPGAGPLVLLVEDDEAVRSVLARVLAREGFGTLLAASAAEALRAFERAAREPDILVCDVILPDRPGPELAKALLRRRPDLPVLFMSGYGADELEQRGDLPSGAPLLPKPFTPSALVRSIRAILDQEMRQGGGGVLAGPEGVAS
jgi:CheY-like chemotaxis protein